MDTGDGRARRRRGRCAPDRRRTAPPPRRSAVGRRGRGADLCLVPVGTVLRRTAGGAGRTARELGARRVRRGRRRRDPGRRARAHRMADLRPRADPALVLRPGPAGDTSRDAPAHRRGDGRIARRRRAAAAPELAAHFAPGGQRRRRRTRRALVARRADRAIEALAYEDAVRHLRRALFVTRRELRDRALECDVLLDLAGAARLAADQPTAVRGRGASRPDRTRRSAGRSGANEHAHRCCVLANCRSEVERPWRGLARRESSAERSSSGSREHGAQGVEATRHGLVPDPQPTLLASDEAGVDEDLHVVADRWL